MDIEKKPTVVPDSILSTVLSQLDSFLGARVDLPPGPDPSGQASLLEQLHVLYDEIEQAGGRRPLELAAENRSLMAEAEALRRQIDGLEATFARLDPVAAPDPDASLVEQLECLYAEIEAAGMSPSELAETCSMLNEQLCCLYEEIEAAGGRGPREQQELIDSLDEQLRALYEEKEASAEAEVSAEVAREMVTSLVDQLHAVYAEKEHDDRDEIIESLGAQLSDLYAEKEESDGVVDSLVEQLHALYAEREAASEGERTLRALEDDRRALRDRVKALEGELDAVRQRARRVVAAVAESALAF